MNRYKTHSTYGSKKFSLSMSDALATTRDAVLVIVASIVTYFSEQLGGLDPELQGALVVVLYAVLKLVWKTITDTTREAPV